MSGRWFNERQVVAESYDGHKKRALPAENDVERQQRLLPPPPAPPAQAATAAASAAGSAGGGGGAQPAARSSRWGANDTAAAAMGSAAPAASETPPVVDTGPVCLPAKTYVKMYGLKNAAERNGQVGVLGSLDATSGRYTVTLRDGTTLALKSANLLQMLVVTVDAGGGAELTEEEVRRSGVGGWVAKSADRQRHGLSRSRSRGD